MGLYNLWIHQRMVNATTCYNPPGKVSFIEPYGLNNFWVILFECIFIRLLYVKISRFKD